MALVVVFVGAGAVISSGRASQDPTPGSPDALTVPYSTFTLPNGLTVILHEDHSVPVISVNVWYRVGSANERPGRTGFAHLFEHLMFEGSGHLPEGEFEALTEGAGGGSNASTWLDHTRYYMDLPSNALDLALFIESDRMGYLLDNVSASLVDGQRDVVKNERREAYENAPYGEAYLRISELMYPADHPYHWPVIGYMDDLSAADADDVREFFRTYYTPANASLVVAGDIESDTARDRIKYWFSDVEGGPAPPPVRAPVAALDGIVSERLVDQVQLPRLFLVWHTAPYLEPGDAEMDVVAAVLADGRASRLQQRLVYDLQIAQSVSAYQSSSALGSLFSIVVTARPGGEPGSTDDDTVDRLRVIVDEELERLRQAPPSAHELERVMHQTEASFYSRMERVGGFGGKADQLNGYFMATGNPDYFNEDLFRYRALGPVDVQAAVSRWLPADRRLELAVVPAGGN